MGIICCICNHKGGVGKTSLTCNLGAALSLKQRKTLVIDNDPQANSTSILLPPNTPIRNSLFELLDPEPGNETSIESCIYPTKHNGLYCIPNVEETSGLEMDFASRYPDSLNFLRNKIRDYTKKHFDYILIDCSPTLSMFVTNALYASDSLIIPIDTSSLYSVNGIKNILELVESIQSGNPGNPDLKFLRLLINRLNNRHIVNQAIVEDIKETFEPNQVFETTILDTVQFQQAIYSHQTIFGYKSSSKAATAYRTLAKEFLSLLE
jgi:chromosome partitioning protein